MSTYYTAKEMKHILDVHTKYRDKLYCRGFLISNGEEFDTTEFPFYTNWGKKILGRECDRIYLYTHKDTTSYSYQDGSDTYFLIGHAYDPFTMQWQEEEILKTLADAMRNGMDAFWDAESNLTGVFCIGCIRDQKLLFATDCAGMQMVYWGTHNGKLYLTSHSKLAADLLNLQQNPYITRLTNNRFWHYWGTFLPGNVSPYKELQRMNPNCYGLYKNREITVTRFYPMRKVEEITTQQEYEQTIHELGTIMENTMKLITKKWPNRKAAISVTGGRDSLTALSCSHKVYDKLGYFSYISNDDEAVDAYAARDICASLGLSHEIFQIPDESAVYEDIDVFKKIMECNAGCIGENNRNDLKKRIYFSENPPCEMEIKSWVNEMGRGWYYNKYDKKRFPKYPYPSYWRCMHKAYINDLKIMKETDQVFASYMNTFFSKEVFDRISWLELFFWEFAWSAGEGQFLTSEHRVSYDITIPFNNRKYIEKMLTVPLQKRVRDCIPIDLIRYEDSRISDTQINVHDVSHTNLRAQMLKIYLTVFSKIRFVRSGGFK